MVTRVLIRGRQQGRSKADVTMEAEKERLDEATLPAGFEDGGRGHKPRTAGGRAWRATVHGVERAGHNLVTKPPQPKSWKRKATRLSLKISRRSASLLIHFELLTSRLEYNKPLSLWQFDTIAIGNQQA